MQQKLPLNVLERLSASDYITTSFEALVLLGRSLGSLVASATVPMCHDAASLLTRFRQEAKARGEKEAKVPVSDVLGALRHVVDAAAFERTTQQVRRARRWADAIILLLLDRPQQTQRALLIAIAGNKPTPGDRSLLHRVVAKLRREEVVEETSLPAGASGKRDGRTKPFQLTSRGVEIGRELSRRAPAAMDSSTPVTPASPADPNPALAAREVPIVDASDADIDPRGPFVRMTSAQREAMVAFFQSVVEDVIERNPKFSRQSRRGQRLGIATSDDDAQAKADYAERLMQFFKFSASPGDARASRSDELSPDAFSYFCEVGK